VNYLLGLASNSDFPKHSLTSSQDFSHELPVPGGVSFLILPTSISRLSKDPPTYMQCKNPSVKAYCEHGL
jgi:hypothetical protein